MTETISQYRGGIQIEASLPLPHAGTPGLQGHPEPCPDPAAPGLRCRSDSRAGVQSPDLSFVSARHEWHLVADTALFAGELPDQQQRTSDLYFTDHFRRDRAHRPSGGVLEPVRLFHSPARVCAGPPGRNTASCFPVRPVAGGYPPCPAPQKLAHPALLRPAHPLLQMYS